MDKESTMNLINAVEFSRTHEGQLHSKSKVCGTNISVLTRGSQLVGEMIVVKQAHS